MIIIQAIGPETPLDEKGGCQSQQDKKNRPPLLFLMKKIDQHGNEQGDACPTDKEGDAHEKCCCD